MAKSWKPPYREWKVYCAPLRPGMHKVIEIHDALGQVVVKWGGFDGTDFPFTQNLKNARDIVKAINAIANGAK